MCSLGGVARWEGSRLQRVQGGCQLTCPRAEGTGPPGVKGVKERGRGRGPTSTRKQQGTPRSYCLEAVTWVSKVEIKGWGDGSADGRPPSTFPASRLPLLS